MTIPSLSRACLALGLLLAGCTSETSEWTPAEAPKSPRVDYVRVQHDAAFKPGSAELAGGEAASLTQFLGAAQVTSADHVYLEAAADDRLEASRIGRLAKIVDQKGAGAQTLPAGAGIPPNHVRVVVERYVVTPPDCPNWSSPAVGYHGNEPGSNFGCADATNLSLMVADPRDLVIGRPLGPAQGDGAFAAAQRYRQGKVKDPSGVTAGTTYAAPQGSGGGASAGTGDSGSSGQ
jgi:pilus assembly protein CpaD